MKFIPILVLATSCLGCSTLADRDGVGLADSSTDLDWEEWAQKMLSRGFDSELPPIPPLGWTEKTEGSWSRHGAQVADMNLDGRIDYIRIADPPSSYNHNVWLDDDYDGRFDARGGPTKGVVMDVPRFEPAEVRLPRNVRTDSEAVGLLAVYDYP